jgi:hypothetical protein
VWVRRLCHQTDDRKPRKMISFHIT